jgi:ABC-type antimicrobial peptide transport system permease subunit
MVLLTCGAGGGLVISLFTSRSVGALLWGIEPADPLTMLGATVVLILTTLSAAWLPARRATKVDPLVALRCE